MIIFALMAGPAVAGIIFGIHYSHPLAWLLATVVLGIWTLINFFPAVMSTDSSGTSKEADNFINLALTGYTILWFSTIGCFMMIFVSWIW
jgi:hypothetical protein